MSNLINLLDTYKGEKRELYPLTPSQMGVYLSCMHNPKGTMYNIPCTYVFDSGSLDTDRLINAVRKAVDNHPIMKIFIDSSTGSPMMKPRDSVEFDIPVVQVNNLEQAGKDFVKPFDLEKDILFRFAVFECGDKSMFATVYKGNIIKNLIMDCQSYTKYRPNETTGGIFVSWRRKEELPTGA